MGIYGLDGRQALAARGWPSGSAHLGARRRGGPAACADSTGLGSVVSGKDECMATTATPPHTTRQLDADSWSDFARLVEANNGV